MLNASYRDFLQYHKAYDGRLVWWHAMDIFFLVFYNSYFTSHSTLVFTGESTRRQTAKQQHRYFHCRAKFSQAAASIVDKVETFQ